MASNSCVPNALLSSYIYDALDMLESEDILDYFRDKGLDRSLRKKLRVSLSSINLVMDDAENKHLSNEHKGVSRWLREVRDAVHDVDDILDEIQTKASQSKLLSVAEFQTTTSSFDEEVQSRLEEVLDNLESLKSEKDDIGFEKINSGAKSVSQRYELTSPVMHKTEIICGRDNDKTKIIDWLNDDNGTGKNNLTLISIVGMAGMGKTTLARLVFNDKKMAEDEVFQLQAWVCVSQDFDVTKVTRKILEAFTLPTCGAENLNMLQTKLKEKLGGKKYLLVLDDVWEENTKKWKDLQAPLSYGARGSKILVTTRNENVASTMQCTHVHKLMQLSKEESWSLFAEHALRHAYPTSHFEKIGKKIIKKCDGLPLALNAIVSLLHKNLSCDEWDRILISHVWEWEISDTGYDIIPALILSYQFLPFSLKRCFAYCSLIPKDHEFEKDWIVELWMAENFLQVRQCNKGMKELGDQFFDDLLSRSFFQRSTSEKELFVMHDLVNDLATYVSGEFCVRLEEEKQSKNITKMTRHISDLKGAMQFEASCKANKLRTFLSSSWYPMYNKTGDLLCQGKCLRALYLCFQGGYFPDSIGNLMHLRYLKLYSYNLRVLPNSICLLYNLQTLKLTSCYGLEELPSNMHKLVNLCHLNFERTKVRRLPNRIGNLKKLEVLSSFYVEKCGEFSINRLGGLKLRDKLSIEHLQNVADPKDAREAGLINKIHLTNLSLRWDSSNEDVKRDGYEIEEDVLEKLQPSTNLKELVIEYYDGTKFPHWLGDICINIVSLELLQCRYCVSLPPLGMLPSLKNLFIRELDGIKSIGAEFYGNNNNKEMNSHPHNSSVAPFRSLQILTFIHMKGWEEWDCENKASFPCLKELFLLNCPRLKSKLPQHLPSLLYLHIEECPQLVATYKKELLGSSYTCLQTLAIWGLEIQILPLYLFPKIHELILHNCRNLERLDVRGVTSHLHLTRLEIWCCPEFVSIPQTLLFPSLTQLCLYNCPKLASIPPFTLFPSLTQLKLYDCPEVEGGGGGSSTLKELTIDNCSKFVLIPQTLFFPSLTLLVLKDCPELEWPEPKDEKEEGGGGGFPSTLKILAIGNCPKLVASHNKWDLHTLTSLTHLSIIDEYNHYVDCQGWLSLPPNLEYLND